MQDYFWIAIGAVLGASARHAANRFCAQFSVLPWGTLLVNTTGSLLLGFFLIWTSERVLADPRWRLFVAVGFCGAYTTFSSYAFETLVLLEQGNWLLISLNILANNILSLGAVIAGAALARSL